MANESIPGPLDRRHLIEKDLSEEKRVALADAYLAEGRAAEAVIFLQQAGARERLNALCDQAVAEGDAFMFRTLLHALDEGTTPDRWLALADAAESAGKLRHADTARRQATRG